MSNEHETPERPEPKKTESADTNVAKDNVKPDISVQEIEAFNKKNKLENQASKGDDPNISRLDLSLGEPKTMGGGPASAIGRSLSTKIDSPLGLPQAKEHIPDLLKENQSNFAASELRWSANVRAPDQFRQGDFFGRVFQQGRKSEFKDEFKPDSTGLKGAIDDFLTETAPKEHRGLTPAERQQLAQTRRAINDAANIDDALANALHLARLYLHLRYIEEAKKAASLALYIDPDNAQGKQLFDELERIHPVDIGHGSFAPPAAIERLTKSQLRKRILEFSKGRIMVVGDLLIDELLEGKAVRISREAPVLILEHVTTELVPGGAANTAHNIAARHMSRSRYMRQGRLC